jgi:biopolymer transport protein ExbB/TolQ
MERRERRRDSGTHRERRPSSPDKNSNRPNIHIFARRHETAPLETDREKRRRVFQQLRRAAANLLAEARSGLGNLAIASSVGPFVGLFGTVWGIMSSFGSIAQTQDTGLAVVAPGIAEALAATAYGLAAAIPAAIGYNRIGFAFSRLDEELRGYVDVVEYSGCFADARDESDAMTRPPAAVDAAS